MKASACGRELSWGHMFLSPSFRGQCLFACLRVLEFAFGILGHGKGVLLKSNARLKYSVRRLVVSFPSQVASDGG